MVRARSGQNSRRRARPIACCAVVRYGRRRVGLDPRPTLDDRSRRRQRRDMDQHRRRLLPRVPWRYGPLPGG